MTKMTTALVPVRGQSDSGGSEVTLREGKFTQRERGKSLALILALRVRPRMNELKRP